MNTWAMDGTSRVEPNEQWPSRKFHHNFGSPQQSREYLAVQTIERAWICHRNRQLFRLLKNAVCAAEQSLSFEIMRKVYPKEAEYLKDRLCLGKVRFRFGGCEFPPMVFFKVFAETSRIGIGLHYLSGKRMIRPASEAAQDACELMGHRKFYEQVLQDIMMQNAHKITDRGDVTTLKDYMQYMSLTDETPSHMGGKENYWRKLTLDDLPRQTIFYDVIDFLYCNRLTPRLKHEIPKLLLKPNNKETLLEQIRIISEIRSPSPPLARTTPQSPASGRPSARRSRQARHRVSRLRKAYGLDKAQPSDGDTLSELSRLDSAGCDAGADAADWEREAEKLFEWTQELSFDDLALTPRLDTTYPS